MVDYRRNKPDNPDAEFFITIVTFNRKAWFSSKLDRDFVLTAMADIANRSSIQIIAWVILPDHIHWLLKPCEADYSSIIFSFKKNISSKFKMRGLLFTGDKFWQDRFWEHTIKDDKERRTYVDYIHYNPVKHNYALSPLLWPHSSFHDFVKRGVYPSGWAEGRQIIIPGSEYDK